MVSSFNPTRRYRDATLRLSPGLLVRLFRSLGSGDWASGRPTGGYPDRDSPPAYVEIISSVLIFDIVRLEDLVLDVTEFLPADIANYLVCFKTLAGEIRKFSAFGTDDCLLS